jgi:hypothetical protein
VSEKAWYAGSPDVHAFGEDAADKRFLLVEVRPRDAPLVTAIPTHTRPFLSLVDGEEWPPGDVAGAIVSYEYREHRDPREVEATVRRLKEAGAVFVRVKAPPPTRRAAVVPDVESLTLTEQMRAWLEEQQLDPDEYLEEALGVVRSFGAE